MGSYITRSIYRGSFVASSGSVRYIFLKIVNNFAESIFLAYYQGPIWTLFHIQQKIMQISYEFLPVGPYLHICIAGTV